MNARQQQMTSFQRPRQRNQRVGRTFAQCALLLLLLLLVSGSAATITIVTPASAAKVTDITSAKGFDCFNDKAGWDHDEDAIVQSIGSASEDPTARQVLKSRSIHECIKDNNYGLTQVMGFGTVMGMLPGVLLIVLLPFFCLGRYCCNIFGSNKRRPSTFCWGGAEDDALDERAKQKLYPQNVQDRWRTMVVITLVLGTIFAGLVMAGKNLASFAYDDWQKGVQSNVINLLTVTFGDLLQFSGNHSFVEPFTATSAHDALGTNPQYLGEYYLNEADTYFTPTEYSLLLTITNGWAVAPLVGFLFLFSLCVFDIRKMLPLLVILFLCAVSIGGGAGVFFGFRILGSFEMMCDEVEIYQNEPVTSELFQQNVGTQRLIPQCRTILTSTSNFRATLANREKFYAQYACDLMFDICSNSKTGYTAGSTTDIQQWYCPYMPATKDAANKCDTVADFQNLYRDVEPRDDADPCGTGLTGCDLRACGSSCRIDQVKHNAKESLISTEVSANMAEAVGNVMDDPCVELIDGLARSFHRCDVGRIGLRLLMAGLICNNILCAFAVIITLKGQKLFFKRLKGRRKRRRNMEDEALMTTTIDEFGGSGDTNDNDCTLTGGEAATMTFKQSMARLRSAKRAGSYHSQNTTGMSVGRATTLGFDPIADDVIMIDSDGEGTDHTDHTEGEDSDEEGGGKKKADGAAKKNDPLASQGDVASLGGAAGGGHRRDIGLPPLANGAPSSKPPPAATTSPSRGGAAAANSRSPNRAGSVPLTRDYKYAQSEMVYVDDDNDSSEYETDSDDDGEMSEIIAQSDAVSEVEDGHPVVTSPF